MLITEEITYNCVCDNCASIITLYELPRTATLTCPHCTHVNHVSERYLRDVGLKNNYRGYATVNEVQPSVYLPN
jgi:hypothetical protein